MTMTYVCASMLGTHMEWDISSQRTIAKGGSVGQTPAKERVEIGVLDDEENANRRDSGQWGHGTNEDIAIDASNST